MIATSNRNAYYARPQTLKCHLINNLINNIKYDENVVTIVLALTK